MEAKLLIVEDEGRLVKVIAEHLAPNFELEFRNSFGQFEATLGERAVEVDVLILDRMMDGRDTVELLTRFKELFPEIAVLILSAIDTPGEKALAIDLGADDYLAKPFELEELSARIRSLLRRTVREFHRGNAKLDNVERVLFIDENEIALSTKEYLLLREFMQHPGRAFSKERLIEDVWKMSSEIESNSLETTLVKLRKKLSEAGATIQIRNSRNLGYWLET